jgi:tripartite-type tricarboxylate transporter receptor subunit TctC
MKKLLLSLFMAISLPALAWVPTKTVEIIVSYPPGGVVDRVARTLATDMEKQGIEVRVKNIVGAGGVIGFRSAHSASPDGHTLLLTPTSLLFSKLLNAPGTDYDIVSGFTHLNALGTVSNGIWSNPDRVKTDLAGIISDENTGKKKYKWGVTNPGAKFTVLVMNTKLKNPVQIVEYKGGPPAIKDLLGGHLDIVVDSGLSVLRQFTEKGQAVYQGSTSAKDVDKKAIANVLPEVVTFSFYGVSLPANVDNNIVQYYNTLLTKMLEDPVFIDKIKGLNLTPVKSSVNVGDIIKKQLQVYGPIAKKLQK